MMRRVPIWTMLPLLLLAACQSGQTGAPPAAVARECPPRMKDSGQCNASSIYSFPELANVN
jgi:hypothetical protein